MSTKNPCMIHWNGNQLCAIDTETTGFDCSYHEMCQLAIIPLDSNIKPRTDVLPFHVHLKLDYPERADPDAMRINKTTAAWLQINGFERMKVIDMLEEWVEKLELGHTIGGRQKQIIPLGQNFSFDIGFMKAWLGDQQYRDTFHYHYRDTMHTAAFLNDRAGMHSEKVPFSKIKLTYLAAQLDVEHDSAHDALQDARITAEVYRKLLMGGLLG